MVYVGRRYKYTIIVLLVYYTTSVCIAAVWIALCLCGEVPVQNVVTQVDAEAAVVR